jgi:hypothetical protein
MALIVGTAAIAAGGRGGGRALHFLRNKIAINAKKIVPKTPQATIMIISLASISLIYEQPLSISRYGESHIVQF